MTHRPRGSENTSVNRPAAPRSSGALAGSRLALPGTTNVRDLVGYPAAASFMVGSGRLLRGEVLADSGEVQGVWDEAHADLFRALGLRTIIDLRAEHEVRKTPSAWQRATGATIVELPLADGGEGADTTLIRRLLTREIARFDEDDLTRYYCDVLDQQAATFGRAIEVLADACRLPALVHCSAGKDRTGLLIALILEVLHTPRTIVVEDYALTGMLRPNRVAAFAGLFADAGVDPEVARVLFETPAQCMDYALQHVDTEYGGAADYLRTAAGVSDETLRNLRDAMLVPAR